MAKKQTKKYSPRAIAITAIITVCLLSLVGAGRYYMNQLNATSNQVSMVAVRELILIAVESMKSPAAKDAKTGDVYFAEAKVFLPAEANAAQYDDFIYRYYKDGEFGRELLVSTKSVVNRKTIKLYSALDIDKMFEAVPALQACSRGVRIIEKETGPDQELLQKVMLTDGRNLYLYGEANCPELEDLALKLVQLQSF